MSNNKPKGILIYPEFPNTFFLTYRILSNKTKEFGGYTWEVEQGEWDDTKHKVADILSDNKKKTKYDLVCFYGTERFGLKAKDIPQDFKCLRISLPKYHPRFLFIPYDFSVYDKVYKDKQDINLNGIITKNDISDFPDWNNSIIKEHLKERGIQKPVFSDTVPQAKLIGQKFEELCFGDDMPGNHYPFRVYYYGAPLTIFYLKHYPEFLPIRIVESDLNVQDNDYKKRFNTYLYIYYKNGIAINDLKEKIQITFFSSYVDAILEPLLLTPMYRLFRENVPRGQFYTMRNVQDFARAITLHCSPDIDTIRKEIWGDAYVEEGKQIKSDLMKLMHDFENKASESTRNEDKDRVKNLKRIKEIALGCRLFLLAFLYKEILKTDYFTDVSQSDFSHINKVFPPRLSYIYNAVITCLAWEYVLSLNGLNVSDVSDAILSNDNKKTVLSNNKNLFLRYKEAELEVVSNCAEFKVKEDGTSYSDEAKDLDKLIAYIESAVQQYVSDALRTMSLNDQRVIYNSFSRLLDQYRDRNDKILYAFLKEMIPYKVYNYV